MLTKTPDKSEYTAKCETGEIETAVLIGGNDAAVGDKFVPNINASKWNDECWLNINHSDVVVAQKEGFVDGEVSLVIGNNTHQYYIDENGKLEYEIIYAARPPYDDEILHLTFSEGMTFWYQPPLTAQEIADGFKRPENVVGSYVAYHSRKDNKYQTGKHSHIYAMTLIDADGKKSKPQMDIVAGATTGTLTIKMDKAWLDAAKYPVTLDPTLGYTVAGGSSFGNATSKRGTFEETVVDSGGGWVVSEYRFYAGTVDAVNKGVKIGLYDANQTTGSPLNEALLEQVEDDIQGTGTAVEDQNVFTSGTNPVLGESVKYVICWIGEDADNDLLFDSGNPGGFSGFTLSGTTYSGEMADPWVTAAGATGTIFSLWAVYAAPAAGEGVGKLVNGGLVNNGPVGGRLTG